MKGSPLPIATKDELEAIYARCERSAEGCLIWTSTKTSGYGLVSFRGKQRLAHRVVLAAKTQLNGGGLDALHSCDNPACVNPDHLRWGDHNDNMRDALERRRFAVGERHGVSKLTAEDVVAIRSSDELASVWADRLGVTLSAVTMARRGERWAHIPTVAIPVRDGQVRGERQGASRLTEALVREIRESDLRGEAAAKRFGVSQSTISVIRRRKSWAHVA